MIIRELLIKLGVKRDSSGFDAAQKGIEGLKRAASIAAAAYAAVAGASGIGALIQAASAAEEQTNKFNAVFGEAAANISAAVDDVAKRTKQSRQEIEGFAANIGALVKPTLGSAAAAGKMGARIAELALDVASFNDLEPELALEKLRAGLIGSAEPLQTVGVDVRQTSKGIEDFARSIGKSTKNLTEAEKVQARFATIVKQLGTQGALGDAQRTADGFANASRALAANIKELAAAIGKFLLARAAKQVVVLRDLALGMQRWIEVNRKFIAQGVERVFRFVDNIARFLVRTLGLLISAWGEIAEVLGPVASKLLMIGAIVGVLIGILGLPAVLIAAIGAAVLAVVEDFQVWRDGGKSVIGFLIGRFEALIGQFWDVRTALTELAGEMIEFFAVTLFGASKDSARNMRQAFTDTVAVIIRLFDNLGKIIGAVLGAPFAAIGELISGNFAAAGRAMKLGAADVEAALRDTEDIFKGGAVSGGRAREIVGGLTGMAPEATAAGRVRGVSGSIYAPAGAASISANTNITIQGDTAQSREFGRGVGEGLAKEQGRVFRKAKAATVGGGAR